MAKPLIATRVNDRLYKALKLIEKSSGSPISDIVRRALREYLKTYRGGRIVEPLEPGPQSKQLR
jgi:hypothetical protein